MEKTRTNKRTIAIVAVVACLALAAALGTYAWLTSTGSLTNNFTTAGINTPEKNPDGEDLPDADSGQISGNLVETKWIKDSKLTPGTSVAKNPNIGLGKGSENAYVFVAVTNKTASATASADNTTYFTINNGWVPVDVTGASPKTATADSTHYLGGLFMYVGTTAEGTTATSTNPVALTASDSTDVWTGELFSQVTTPTATASGDFATNPSIDVNYYISAADDDNDEGSAASALTSAKTWYGDLS